MKGYSSCFWQGIYWAYRRKMQNPLCRTKCIYGIMMIHTLHILINKYVRMITQMHACAHNKHTHDTHPHTHTHTQGVYNQTKHHLWQFAALRCYNNSVPQLPHMIKLYFIHLIDFLFTKFHHWTKIYTFNVVILLGNTESMMKYNPKTAILQNKMKNLILK